MKRPASIRARLLRSLWWWALLWCTALGVAEWLTVREEVNELLDDTLQSAAEGLLGPLVHNLEAGLPAPGQAPAPAPAPALAPAPAPAPGSAPVSASVSVSASAAPPALAAVLSGPRFVWQLVSHQGPAQVLRAARGAPAEALRATPSAGFADVPGWRVYGLPLGLDAQMLYVAQSGGERREAQAEIAFAALLAGLPMLLLALLWLSARVRHELAPLQALSQRLADYDPLQPGATLGVSEHEELRPVQDAIDGLAGRLVRRVAQERAFAAHAAHALRTPLAGIDAQLAVALREAPETLQPRLQRVRAAAVRLQRVVTALLTLFRSGGEVQRTPLDLPALAQRLPLEGLTIQVQALHAVQADADLLTAALLNLLDNALRHGARNVWLSTPAAQVLRVQDDGSGVTLERRLELQQALDAQAYEGRTGLGLMLADLVARAHGGRLHLAAVPQGFAAVLHLAPA